MRLILAVLHLLALGIGLGAVWSRARALRGDPDTDDVRRASIADAWWGVAAVLWLATGLARWLLGTEKASAYYLANSLFHAKLGTFLLIVALEIWPMIVLSRWRRGLRSSSQLDTAPAARVSLISTVQALLVAIIVALAAAMARGYGVIASG